MPEIDPWKHASFIYACYLIVGFLVTALTVWMFRSETSQRKKLARLEKELQREEESGR